ncbi:hypothetical protein HY988_05860 [Candidatus Micrarchaeota archaeon]|nr:hypothetical protein [Candidatus Micrarchaeota archaeon]
MFKHAGILVLSILVVVLIAGCITPPQPSGKLPKDLEIRYSYGACKAEWGRTITIITADGNGIYESGKGSFDNDRFQSEEFRKTFKLNETQMLSLLSDIEKSGFYSLDDYYSNNEVFDGSCSSIFVTKNNITKSVAVSNTDAPQAYTKVADLISEKTKNAK